MPKWIQRLTRKTHKSVYGGLKVSGKKGYYDKWCPDEDQKSGLHLIFPAGTPGVQDIVAVMHFANISIRGLVLGRMKGLVKREKKGKGKDRKEKGKALADKEVVEKNDAENPEAVMPAAQSGSVEEASTVPKKEKKEIPKGKPGKGKSAKKESKKVLENGAQAKINASEKASAGLEQAPQEGDSAVERSPDHGKQPEIMNGDVGGTEKRALEAPNGEHPSLPERSPERVSKAN